MKYNLHVNQLAAIELGITNINQAIIFDFLTSVAVWADEIILDNKVYYWISRQRIAKELLILNLTEDTIYRHLKNLAKLEVILYMKQDKKDLIKLTIKAKRYTSRNDDYVLDTRFDSFVSKIEKNYINKVILIGLDDEGTQVHISIDKKGKLFNLKNDEKFSKARSIKIWHILYTHKAKILQTQKGK